MEKIETRPIISNISKVHPAFFTLIKELPDNPILKEVLSNKESVVVDIGCRNPNSLYILYHDFDIKHLYGIEKDSESDSVKDYVRQMKMTEKDTSSKTIYDLYLKYLSFSEEELKEGKHHLSIEEFQETFKLTFGEWAQDYLSDNFDDNYIDIIIIEDVLHLANPIEARSLLNLIIKKLKPGGLISVKVNHNENKEAVRLNHFTFSDKELLDLFPAFETVYTCRKIQDEETKSILYIGKKL